MMFCAAPLPSLQLFMLGASTIFCVAVIAWTVVISPSSMPNLSWTTLAIGARQFVVQEALEITFMEGSKVELFTPITNMGASAEGAEMITLWAPALRWGWHFSMVVKTPVDSITVWTPQAPHPMLAGSLSA